jgi:cytochrome c-type biogenesis protein
MDFSGFLASTETLVNTSPSLAFVAVFLGGVMTAANPCVLAMIPLMMGFVGGSEGLNNWKKSLGFSLIFVCGLALTFTVMGLIAVLLGKLFGSVGSFWPYLIALVCLAMGAHLWELWSFSVPEVFTRYQPKRRGVVGAFLLGMLFGVVSAPCAAPVLVVVLTLIAKKANLAYGMALLWTYGVGHSLLIVVAGTTMGVAKHLLESKNYIKANYYLKRVAGLAIAAAGLYILNETI